MSRSLRWIRAYLGEALLVSLIATTVVATLVAYTFLLLRTNLAPVTALPWAVMLGQIAASTRLALAISTNPLSLRYLNDYIATPFRFAPFPGDAEDPGARPADVDEALHGWRLSRTIAVHDPDADPSPVFDLFHSPSGVVLAAVSRATGSLALMTQLADGRILHTADLVVPPHPSMVVNTVHGSPHDLARAHTRLLAMLGTLEIRPAQTGVRVFADVMAAEHAAYADLGAFLGSVLNIDGRVSPNLSYTVDIDDLLEQTLL